MKSKWSGIKEQAISMRGNGCSLRDIEIELLVPKSTLSGWFKDISLNERQKTKLNERWRAGLVIARLQAAKWHKQQKIARLAQAENDANTILSRLDITDNSVLEIALAMLYLGEGAKKGGTILGSSNPLILKFFIAALCQIYGYDSSFIRCELHLRADQDPEQMKTYWSTELNVPIKRFKSVSIDKRTVGRPTYPHYKGVCVLRCANVAIQRRLVYLSEKFCEKIANSRAVSSVGRASA